MYKRFIFCTLFIISLISNYALGQEVNNYNLDIIDFTELKVNNSIDVIYNCSDDTIGKIEFTCTPELSKYILFTTNKNSLSIQTTDDYDHTFHLPVLHVSSSKLEKVQNGADSTITIESNTPVKSFKAIVIGNGLIKIKEIETNTVDLSVITGNGQIFASKGNAFKAKYSNVGTGTIQAGGIKASQVRVAISGTGSVDCDATEKLTVYGMGSGYVYYSGNPLKVSNRSIGVKAYPINTEGQD